MIVVVGLLLASLVVTNVVWLLGLRSLSESFARDQRALAGMIQHPEIVRNEQRPLPPDEELLSVIPDPDWEMAGTVDTGEPDG